MRLLLMGPPGAGKGTQARLLAKCIGVPHISTGDIFRTHVRERTALGQAAERYLDAGGYVPDQITNAMVKDRLAHDDARHAFVLDGYPRTRDQAHILDAIVAEYDAAIDYAIELQVGAEHLVNRLLLRAHEGGRTDDTEDVIRRRQSLYLTETRPLLAVYAERNRLIEIDGVGTVAGVFDRIGYGLRERQARQPEVLPSAQADVSAPPDDAIASPPTSRRPIVKGTT
jgi:adenylate kinase